MSDNTITLTGNVTRDPELRYTTGGKAVASFGLAVNRRYQSNGEWQEHTSFFDVVAWGTLGENASGSLTKGNRIVISGRMDQRNWETEDGEKRSKLEVVADEIGASLRWAKVQIEKVTRTESDPAHPPTPLPKARSPSEHGPPTARQAPAGGPGAALTPRTVERTPDRAAAFHATVRGFDRDGNVLDRATAPLAQLAALRHDPDQERPSLSPPQRQPNARRMR